MNYNIIYEDKLSHHGIPEQKWGVRRFQNPDGTLTPAGKERYARRQYKAQMKEYKKQKRQERLANVLTIGGLVAAGVTLYSSLKQNNMNENDQTVSNGQNMVQRILSDNGNKSVSVFENTYTPDNLGIGEILYTPDDDPVWTYAHPRPNGPRRVYIT